jgi:site-specific DNA-methyltransferase (adenine-specific)
VWCVTVPTGAFVARRNGKIFITGNSGFPKGLDIAKGIDKYFGKEPKIVGEREDFANRKAKNNFEQFTAINPSDKGINSKAFQEKMGAIYEFQTDQAKQWDGWNTNLKPAYEPIILARKPLDGTVVNNVLKHGVGGLNIGACRVEATEFSKVLGTKRVVNTGSGFESFGMGSIRSGGGASSPLGRYPANLIHDGSEEATGGMPWTKSPKGISYRKPSDNNCMSGGNMERYALNGHDDQGSASRYFYCAKASKADRDEGLEGFELKQGGAMGGGEETRGNRPTNHPMRSNFHPTVKPTALMQYVTKLITPLNGTVLDPFMGSGSTGKACMLEGFNFTGIELSSEYLAIAEARIKHAQSLANRKQLKLDV